MSTMKQRIAAIEQLDRKTPDALLKAARHKNHPLHKDFDWNDKTAGHKYRLDIARGIIASVRVVINTTTMNIRSVGYVRDLRSPPRQQGYVSVATLRDDADYAQEALDAEVIRIKSLLERAREFATVVGLRDELEVALESLMVLHSRSRRPRQPAAQPEQHPQ